MIRDGQNRWIKNNFWLLTFGRNFFTTKRIAGQFIQIKYGGGGLSFSILSQFDVSVEGSSESINVTCLFSISQFDLSEEGSSDSINMNSLLCTISLSENLSKGNEATRFFYSTLISHTFPLSLHPSHFFSNTLEHDRWFRTILKYKLGLVIYFFFTKID